MVYVLSCDGKPLMPTTRHGKVRRMLRDGKAKVVRSTPFTIQLLYESEDHVQPVKLGVDAGYMYVGFSALSSRAELMAGELKLLDGMVERIKEKAMYKRQRRQKLRYRKMRWGNRGIPKGGLAPSINHKLDSHIRLVDLIKSILPVSSVVVEVAAFDIYKIKNPEIEGVGYQNGPQTEFWNVREYILHRDGHKCQNPGCGNKAKEIVLKVHHIGYWKHDRTDRPDNLISLCSRCHTPENHAKGGFLYGWKPKMKSFKDATFMSTVRWKMVDMLGSGFTYGFITKSKRIELGLPKSHTNDAFCIAGGFAQSRIMPLSVRQVRRNDRCLQKFYDAKYIDIRTGEPSTGKVLNCGRTTRNKNKNGENLKKYRGEKLKDGRVSIQTSRYPYQPGDLVRYEGKIFTVKGVFNYGAYIRLVDKDKNVLNVQAKKVSIVKYKRGFVFEYKKNEPLPVQYQLSSGMDAKIPA